MGVLRRLIVVALAGSLGACTLLLDHDPGVRDPGGGDGGAGGDGGDDGDAGEEVAPCGSVARLQDTFPQPALSERWIVHTQGVTAAAPIINGASELSLGFSSGPAMGEFVDVESKFAYDMRGQTVTVYSYTADNGWWSTLEIREPARFGVPRRVISLGHKGPDFVAAISSPTYQEIESVPFGGGSHRYLRIREAAGTLEFEVAGVDAVFSPFATLPIPGLDLSAVAIGLRLFAENPPQNNASTIFDNFVGGAVADPACPAGTLRDDFSAAELGSLWYLASGPAESDAQTGSGLTLSADAGETCEVVSAHAYSFASGGQLVVELASIPTDVDARLQLRLVNGAMDYIELRQQAGVLRAIRVETSGSGSPASVPNAVTAQWWRITERAGQLDVETSPDGADYTLRYTIDAGNLDLSEMRVSFTLEVNAPVTAVVGSVNTSP